MKKQLLMLAAVMVTGSVLAQGTIGFNNANAIVKIDGANAGAAANARVQLVWANPGATVTAWTPSTSLSAWLAANSGVLNLIPNTATVGVPLAGRFSGGEIVAATPTPGANITAWVIGWSGPTAYANFDAAFNAGIGGAAARVGVSSPFTVDTGNPNALPSPEPAGDILGLQAFNLVTPVAVPEPTSFALAGLGAAALLIFRRRS